MITVGIILLSIAIAYVIDVVWKRRLLWKERRKFIEEHAQYIGELQHMDAEYKPEEPDLFLAERCKEYLSSVFPEGIEKRVQNMTNEELIELFKKLEKDVEELMGVQMEKVDLYTTDTPPECRYCGFYRNSDKSFHLNLAYVLSHNPEYIKEQVYTIFHELKHARQWAAVDNYSNNLNPYGYSEDQIRLWAKNFSHYIPPQLSDELYRKQPVEKDAFGFETLLK